MKDNTIFEAFFVKDPHYRPGFAAPESRKETFQEEVDKKNTFIIEEGKRRGVKKLFFTGDILDFKQPSKYTFTPLKKHERLFQRLKKNFDTYTIDGNHDMPYSSQTVQESPFLHLIEHKLITRIDEENPQIFSKPIGDPKTKKQVKVWGIPYKPSVMDVLEALSQLDEDMSEEDYNIIILHEHCVPVYDNGVDFVDVLSYDELVQNCSKVNAFVCGHLHKGYPTQYHKDVLFINPWNLTRVARSYYTLNEEHKPTVTYLGIDYNPETRKYEARFEDIIVPHLPFQEAFDIRKLELRQKRKIDIQKFAQTVSQTKFVAGKLDTSTLRDEVHDLVEEYLSKAEED